MRAYIATSRRTGISMPVWLVPLAFLAWVTVMFSWWLIMLAVWLAVTGTRLARKGWERWR